MSAINNDLLCPGTVAAAIPPPPQTSLVMSFGLFCFASIVLIVPVFNVYCWSNVPPPSPPQYFVKIVVCVFVCVRLYVCARVNYEAL